MSSMSKTDDVGVSSVAEFGRASMWIVRILRGVPKSGSGDEDGRHKGASRLALGLGAMHPASDE
jgi:hypothetical protein